MTHNVPKTLHALMEADSRGSVWCAALCALTVQHLIPVGEHRPGTALRLALLWAQGAEVSARRLEAAAHAVSNAALDADDDPANARYAGDVYIHGAYDAPEDTVAAAYHAQSVDLVAAATFVALAVGRTADVAKGDIAAGRHRVVGWNPYQLEQLVDHQLTPISPTDGQHPLWDWTLERHPEPHRVGTLGDALARARRWRLRWWVPHERAIAERLTELPTWWTEREVPS